MKDELGIEPSVDSTGNFVYKYPIGVISSEKYKQIKHYQRAKTKGAFGGRVK